MIDKEGEVRCSKCLPGVTGNLCDRCMKGYYGTPELGCRKCRCNDNLDMSRETPCDQQTGRCLACVEGTGGAFCERCSTDYWSPSPGRDCQRCECPVGRRQLVPCNPRTGDCYCKPGYTGRNCSSCQLYTYGYLNDEDCKNCSCDVIGSHSLHCNGTTGDCFCKRGHTGRKCDKCQDGYWRHARQPCSECDNCARKMLVTLEETSIRQTAIKSISQDNFISKTTAKLKHLQNKSNRIKDQMLHRISVFRDLKETATNVQDIYFSPSKQPLHIQADNLWSKNTEVDFRIKQVALGLDSSLTMKNQYFRDAAN
ncbi:laminin subunit beta-1-like [Bolinopsis microptera]|uniref:laminin subunit beta-1-like n=1 Tax=Bolinopsis microptera TaxID=2820187 RepID=UPI0030799CCD